MFQGVSLFSVYFRYVTLFCAWLGDPRSVNTAIEFSKIRQALALVESHVNYIQRSPASGSITPSQPSFDASASITLGTPRLNEDPSKSDLSEPEAPPGTRGQSSRGGLYAGPTSTVSLLTSVCFLRVSHSAEWSRLSHVSAYFMHNL
jgi:hypothetical protein